jgi:methionyl-tRNA formyltransferase
MKIVYIATPSFGAIILEKLIKAGHKPFLVITETDKPIGRKQTIVPPPVKVLAEEYHIPVAQPEKIGLWQEELKKLEPDLGIIASYGQILPKEILEIPKYGFINVHPSLLPKYRGSAPIQYAILNGDDKTGVTIMRVAEKLDAGPILVQEEIAINQNETFLSLHDKLADLGAKLLIEALPKLIAGRLAPQDQDETKATFTKRLKIKDGLIDLKEPAEISVRKIRALNPEPGTYSIYNSKRLKILEAKVEQGRLIINQVQLEGKKPMAFEDFLRGHKDFYVKPQ